MFLPHSYKPQKQERKVSGTAEVQLSHETYFVKKPSNLRFLIKTRYEWMRPYLKGKTNILELGAGAGFSRDVLPEFKIKLTDVDPYPWIDQQVDALSLPFDEGSFDAVICSYVIHHLASPYLFFEQAFRVLKPGGLLIINESHSSFLLKLMLYLIKHEGWSYEVDIFDKNYISSPEDAWDGNNAVGNLLFRDHKEFERHFPQGKITYDEFRECFLFLISGGVTAQFKTIQLPPKILSVINKLDEYLTRLSPNTFALVRRLVIEKRPEA